MINNKKFSIINYMAIIRWKY